MTSRSTRARRPPIRVGQRVWIPLTADSPVLAEIVEDRGAVGWKGRRIVRVRTLDAMEEARRTFEWPVEELTFFEEGPVCNGRARASGSEIGVGDRVAVQYPTGPVLAEVIEDRGPLGVGGRRILRVRTLEELEDTRQTLEVPDEELLRV